MPGVSSHQRLSPEALDLFIETLACTGKVTEASARVGISTDTATKWRNRSKRNPHDPKYQMGDPLGDDPVVAFHEAWEQAIEASTHVVESSLVELATGHYEPVIFQGRQMFVLDHDQPPIVDRDWETGEATYRQPYKLDAAGEPIPLMIRRVNVQAQKVFLEARHNSYRPKIDIDVSSQGKPIAVPQRSGSVAEFLAEFGRKVETE